MPNQEFELRCRNCNFPVFVRRKIRPKSYCKCEKHAQKNYYLFVPVKQSVLRHPAGLYERRLYFIYILKGRWKRIKVIYHNIYLIIKSNNYFCNNFLYMKTIHFNILKAENRGVIIISWINKSVNIFIPVYVLDREPVTQLHCAGQHAGLPNKLARDIRTSDKKKVKRKYLNS